MRGWLLGFVALLVLVSIASAQYQAETVFAIRRPTATTAAAWVTVSGDSGSVAALYPCDNGVLADSSGRRVDMTWSSAIGGWIAEVDTTNDYSVFYRTGCCAETLATALQCRRLWGPVWPSALIANPEAFEAGVVDEDALADGAITGTKFASSGSPTVADFSTTGPDSMKFETIVVDQLLIHDAFLVKTAVGSSTIQGTLEIDGSGSQLKLTSGADADFDDALNVDGNVTLNGSQIDLGNSVGDQIIVQGDLNTQDDTFLGNTSGDETTISGNLNTQEDANLGNDTGDDTAIAGDLNVAVDSNLGNDTSDQVNVAGDLVVTDDTTLNDAVSLGNNTGDAITITGDFTAEGDFTVEDSLVVGTDMGAADSLKSTVRVNRWFIEGNSDMMKTFTVPNGSTTTNFDWPGAQTDDMPFCNCTNATSSSGTSKAYEVYVVSTGQLNITRDGSTGDLVLRCILFKM